VGSELGARVSATWSSVIGSRFGRDPRAWALAVAGVAALIAVNVVFLVLPINYRAFGMLAYPGVFLVCFIANATTFVPVPYIPVVMHVSRSADLVWLVVVLGALGSVLGESVAFFVGRAGERLAEESQRWRSLERLFTKPWLAGVALFALAVPPNPLFDIAGLAAGALGVRYAVFFVTVFAARIIRLAAVAWLGMHIA
jgi:membrane protein YqaA with SNARE-associated domain